MYPFFYRPSGLNLQDQWGLSSPETFYNQMKDLVSNLYPPLICTVSGGGATFPTIIRHPHGRKTPWKLSVGVKSQDVLIA